MVRAKRMEFCNLDVSIRDYCGLHLEEADGKKIWQIGGRKIW